MLFSKFKTFIHSRISNLDQLSLFLVLFLTLLPIFFMAGYRSIDEFKEHNALAFSQRGKIVHAAASLIEQKLGCVMDVSASLSDTALFRKTIKNGSWGVAVNFIKEGLAKRYYYIDTISLYDPQGTLRSTTSGDTKDVGKNFASEDYYVAVSKNWQPYISGAFKKINNQKYDVFSVAVPVWSDAQKITGVLVLDIKLDVIGGWVDSIDTDHSGFIYVVDQKGHLIVYPHFSPNDDIADHSRAPAVQKVLSGERGAGIMIEPSENEEQLAAYEPVSLNGWGVVALQPISRAFADRNKTVMNSIIIFGLIVVLTGFFIFRILKSKAMIKVQSEREQRLIDSLGDGVVATDKKWNITLWNKAASVITGWSKEEVIGKPVHPVLKLIRERDRKEVLPLEYAFVEKKASSLEENTLLVRKDGSEIPVGDSAAPILNEGNTPDGAIIIFRDLSQEREAGHLRSDFAYATHQLRTPVTEALWNLDIAIEEEDPVKRKEDIEVVHQSLQSVQKLTEDLVAVSEFDQGSVSVKKSVTKLIDIFTEVQNKLASVAKKRNVEISIAPISPVVAVNTDPKFFKKILHEIIENAVTYSQPGTRVNVMVTFHEKELIVEVSDTGMGIAEEQQPLLFTKFFRGSNSGNRGAGSGLGLFLAKESIKLIDGKIWFTSEEGKGTTFYISLPIE